MSQLCLSCPLIFLCLCCSRPEGLQLGNTSVIHRPQVAFVIEHVVVDGKAPSGPVNYRPGVGNKSMQPSSGASHGDNKQRASIPFSSEVPATALRMFWHIRGKNKHLHVCLMLCQHLLRRYSSVTETCWEKISCLGAVHDNTKCTTDRPNTNDSAWCVLRDRCMKMWQNRLLAYRRMQVRKYISASIGFLHDQSQLSHRQLRLLTKLYKPVFRHGRYIFRIEPRVRYLFFVSHIQGQASMRAQLRKSQLKARVVRAFRKLQRINRKSPVSTSEPEVTAHQWICMWFQLLVRISLLCNLCCCSYFGSTFASAGIAAWLLGRHCQTSSQCRFLSMCLVWMANDLHVRHIWWSLLAFVFPLFPPSAHPVAHMDAAYPPGIVQNAKFFDDIGHHAAHSLARCLQARTFQISVDESDALEAPVRAMLPLHCTPATTNGDGACAIHSVWGQPDAWNQLTCPDARSFAAASLGPSLSHLRTNISPEFREDVDKIASSLWSELMVKYLQGGRTNEMKAFKQHLHPDLFREAQACFSQRASRRQDMDACEARIRQLSTSICSRSLERQLIRPLAVVLGVIPRDCDVLKMTSSSDHMSYHFPNLSGAFNPSTHEEHVSDYGRL